MWKELARTLESGDPYVIIMLILCFLGFTVFFERLIMLRFTLNLNVRKFVSEFRKYINTEDNDRAVSLCQKSGKSLLPAASMRALELSETNPKRIRAYLEEEGVGFLPQLAARTQFIPTIVTLTIVVGAFATIDGMWSTFVSMDVLDTVQKQAIVSDGVASSLIYSALALLISLPLLCFQHLIKGFAADLGERTVYGLTVVQNLLSPDQVAYSAVGAAPIAQAEVSAEVGSAEDHSDDILAMDDASVDDDSELVSEDDDTDIEEDVDDEIRDEEEII